MGYDGSLTFDTQVDTGGFISGTNSIKKSAAGLGTVFTKLGGVIAAAFSVKRIIDFGREAVALASDLEEVQNVVDTAFGEMSHKMEAFAETCMDTYGISKLTAKQMGSTFMAMAKGMGQASDIASDKAVEITGRLADIMSFYNKTAEQADTIGRAVYSGETEPLKAIGVIMNETNLSTYALSKGYKQLYKDMSAADKLFVRQEYFLEQTGMAAGDFAKTVDSWANQTKILSERWKEFLTLIGGNLVQILAPGVRWLNNAMSKMISFANAASAAMATVFGTKKQAIAISSATENVEGLADAVADVGTNAKKSVAPFDELVQIGGSMPGIDAAAGIRTGTPDTDILTTATEDAAESSRELEESVSRVIRWFRDLFDMDWDRFNAALVKCGNALKPLANSVGKGFIDFIKNVLEFTKDGFVAIIDGISFGLDAVGSALETIDPDILRAVGESIGAFLGAVTLAAGAGATVGILKKLGTGLAAILTSVGASPLTAVAAGAGAVAALAKFFDSIVDIDTTELQAKMEVINAELDDMNSLLARIDEFNKGQTDKKVRVGILLDAYFELADRDDLTPEEEQKLKEYAALLVDEYGELADYIDVATGQYDGTRLAIEGVIAALNEYIELEAGKSFLVEARKEIIETGIALKGLNKEIDGMEDSIYAKVYGSADDPRRAMGIGYASIQKINGIPAGVALKSELKELADAKNKAAEAEAVLGQLNDAYDALYQTVTKQSVSEMEKAAVSAAQESENTAKSVLQTVQEYSRRVTENTAKESETAAKQASQSLIDFSETVKSQIDEDTDNAEKSFSDLMKSVEKQWGNLSLPNKTLTVSMKLMEELTQIPKNGSPLRYVPKYASGNVIPANYGEFLAILGDSREPEVVAPVSAIKKAAKEAAKEAFAELDISDGSITVVVEMDGDVVVKKMVQKSREHKKRTGEPLFE